MAAGKDKLPIYDDDWLVQRARGFLKTDPYAAKAWLITARTFYPRNFAIQFEAYTIEKSNKNIKDAAKHLEEMFVAFPQEAELWNEVHSFSEALQSDITEERILFLRDLFAGLPTSLQCHLLLKIADNSTDVLEQCRLMLLLLGRYPERVPDQGVKLMESLLTTEKHMHVQTPVNCYRKYLVCDVLPLVLAVPLPDVSQKHFIRWLQKAMEFYMTYVTQSPSQEAPTSQSPDVLSPNKKMSFGGFRRHSIAGLPEKDSAIPQPWEKLFTILRLTGGHLGWTAADIFTHRNCESQRQAICNVYQAAAADPASVHKQVLHSTTLIFLHCLFEYSSRMEPNQFAGSTGGPGQAQPLVMIEGFKAGPGGTCSPPRSKRARLDNPAPPIHASKNISNSQEVIENFKTALKCWELLHSSDMLEKEFTKLLQIWRAESWTWLKSFEVDMLIYQGQFRDAVNQLQAARQASKNTPQTVRANLQTACCYYCLGNFSRACESVLAVVNALPVGSEPCGQEAGVSGSGRQVQLLSCSEGEVMPYCIQLMITCFREKAFKHLAPDDMSLGHMVVLLQYDWPRYEMLFGEVLTKIQKLGSFTYNLFFNYVINIDVLEQFAYLRTMDSGRISLDILSTSTKTLAQQRTVTRGVNKGVKEDFKVAMEKQVARSNENIENVIRQFLQEEKEILQQNLL